MASSRTSIFLLLAIASCSRTPAPVAVSDTPAPPRWPKAGSRLESPVIPTSGDRRWRIYVDAGHGADGNAGTQSAICEREEVFTLRVANDLAARLPALGPFDVRVSRDGSKPVSYPARVEESAKWKADAFVAIHMDARGIAEPWLAAPGVACWRNDGSPGFSVLWSSEGDAAMATKRQSLARALAARMETAGFLPYDGVDYPGHYVDDADHRAVFENRLGVGRRIYLLRKPAMPAVIIETHHALHLDELTRWQEPRTLEVFAAAVAAGLLDALDPPVPEASLSPR